jgi:hypothetical protein
MPVTSTTQIANMALSGLGIGYQIADLDADSDAEAQICRLHFEAVRDTLLEAHAWPWANAQATLALVAEDPNEEWDYSYRLPSDCAAPRRIQSVLGMLDPNPEPYVRGDDPAGGLILTNASPCVLFYTRLVTNVALYPMTFVNALAFALASMVAEPLSAKPERAREAERKAADWLGRAMATGANQQQLGPMPDSEFMRARL